ncbi:hypothetical protein HQQ81_01495 [Microbacteriaceae bacterium VKM Ac-2854]|nr:hypothetical protein [Microbacteriaceae bacterium VKM Ac-2854]
MELSVHVAEQAEEDQAAHEQQARSGRAPLGRVQEEREPDAEEEGEDREEAQLNGVVQRAGDRVRRLEEAGRNQLRHAGDARNVHEQDAAERESAQDVEGDDPGAAGGGGRRGRSREGCVHSSIVARVREVARPSEP